MSKLNYIKILIISFVWINISCEDLLDKTPQDRLHPTVYFKTEEELKLFTNQFYNQLIPSAASVYNETADIIVPSTLMNEMTGQRVIPDDGGGWGFSALRDINFYLQHSNQCNDEAVRNKYDGVARFFRAFFYFDKVRRFGDVPWYDTALESTSPDLYKPRDSREFVMQKIMEDLDFAITNLPAEKDPYRITKWTALALKSRVALFEGTFRKYHGLQDYEKYLDLCIAASETFMSTSGYTLYNEGKYPYRDLFASMDAKPEEIILGRDYNASLSVFHSVQNYENSSSMGKPGLNKKIVNSYLMSNGSRFTDKAGYQTMTFQEETQNRDPRLAQTIRTPGYKRIGGSSTEAPNLAFTMTGYHLIKYTLTPNYDGYNKSCNDMPIFRTAEIYLNFAEAKAERGTLSQADLDKSIKLIRERAGMPNLRMDDANASPDPYLLSETTGYPHVQGVNKGVILEIRRERTIELMMEGFRYWDLMRWKEGKLLEKELLGIYIPGPGIYDLDGDGKNDVCFYEGTKPSARVPLFLEIGKQIQLKEGNKGNIICHKQIEKKWNEDRDYLYPIPINDRTLTNGALTQNPGWNDGLSFQ